MLSYTTNEHVLNGCLMRQKSPCERTQGRLFPRNKGQTGRACFLSPAKAHVPPAKAHVPPVKAHVLRSNPMLPGQSPCPPQSKPMLSDQIPCSPVKAHVPSAKAHVPSVKAHTLRSKPILSGQSPASEKRRFPSAGKLRAQELLHNYHVFRRRHLDIFIASFHQLHTR